MDASSLAVQPAAGVCVVFASKLARNPLIHGVSGPWCTTTGSPDSGRVYRKQRPDAPRVSHLRQRWGRHKRFEIAARYEAPHKHAARRVAAGAVIPSLCWAPAQTAVPPLALGLR